MTFLLTAANPTASPIGLPPHRRCIPAHLRQYSLKPATPGRTQRNHPTPRANHTLDAPRGSTPSHPETGTTRDLSMATTSAGSSYTFGADMARYPRQGGPSTVPDWLAELSRSEARRRRLRAVLPRPSATGLPWPQ